MGRVGDALCGLLEEVARDPLLEVDDAEAVDDRLRRIAVDDAAHAEVADREADPQADLEAEVPPTTRENATTCCDDSAHTVILDVAAGVPNHPPMYDISTFRRVLVSAVRSSE